MDLAKLKTKYHHLEEGVLLTDAKGLLLYHNPAAPRHLGTPAPKLGHMLETGQGGGLFLPALQKAIATGRKVTLIQQDREGKHFLTSAQPLSGSSGGVRYYLCRCSEASRYPELELSEGDERFDPLPLKRVAQLQGDTELFGFTNPAMQRVLARIEKVAGFDANVILLGESGVGKNVFANLIHRLSPRSGEPFIYINCGAIPPNLFESELFGYEKGAFTGASRSHTGLIEQARGGTVFFDEVAELPLEMQSKILHFINEKFIYKISGTRPIQVDARIISATNRDLKGLIGEKRFREDLYYRLNVVRVEIPPLRERKEDLEILIHHYVSHFNTRYCLGKRLSEGAMERLMAYPWPGNIRELRNVVEQLVILSERDSVTPQDFPPELAAGIQPTRPALPRDGEQEPETVTGMGTNGVEPEDLLARGMSLEDMLERYEGEIFRRLYPAHNSSYKLARLLGISQTKASRKIRQYCKPEENPEP